MKGKGSVLIADDERAIVDATARLLKGRGYDCECVLSGEEALAALRVRQFDVLVTDIKMDGNRELELVRALPTVAPGLQAVIVTGHAEVQTAVAAHDLPVAAYLLKPVEVEALVAAVDRAVEQHKLHDAVAGARGHIAELDAALVALQTQSRAATRGSPGLRDFFALTLGNTARSLADLAVLAETWRPSHCSPTDCLYAGRLRSAAHLAVEGLEETKNVVRSRKLAEARRRLEEACAACGDGPEPSPDVRALGRTRSN